jgi:phage gpG-like protein
MKHENQINNWFANFNHRFDTRVPNIVAETATSFYKERFEPQNQDWDGVKWKPLNPRYAARKTRGKGRILYASSNLQASIKPSMVTQNRVRISAGNAKVPYAAIHNEGLRVTGTFQVKQHVKPNFMGKGKRQLIKSHKRSVNYKMPQRQFMGHSPRLNRILIDRLTTFFNSQQ